MGKDLGIMIAVKLTRLCKVRVSMLTLMVWATLYAISDINTNHVPNSVLYGMIVYLG